MNLPFTVEQFLDVFAEYNLSVWPFQIVLYLFALTAVFLTIKRFSYGNKIVSGILDFSGSGLEWYIISFSFLLLTALLTFLDTLYNTGIYFFIWLVFIKII